MSVVLIKNYDDDDDEGRHAENGLEVLCVQRRLLLTPSQDTTCGCMSEA